MNAPVRSGRVVAVIGRPNVGKSTLVNRLAERPMRGGSIVGPSPGLTRDRVQSEVSWRGREFVALDTGGLDDTALQRKHAESLAGKVAAQAMRTALDADLVLFLVDARTGLTSEDLPLVERLRRLSAPVIVVANKIDDAGGEAALPELWGMGLGEPMPVSALNGRGVGDLLDRIVDLLPEGDPQPPPDVASIAIVGRPNVGKSSLFNQIAGREAAIVHPDPGTTRDAIDTLVALGEETYRFVDTAGLRRHARTQGVEVYGAARARRAIQRSDLAIVVVDASEGATAQDQRIAEAVGEAGVGAIVALNKWDLVKGEEEAKLIEKSVAGRLHFVDYAPLVRTSALTRRGVEKLLVAIDPVLQARAIHVPTPALNALIADLQQETPIPRSNNRSVRVLYATQAERAPPTLVLFSSGRIAPTWLRFVERRLREQFGFEGNPIGFVVRERTRRPKNGRPRRSG